MVSGLVPAVAITNYGYACYTTKDFAACNIDTSRLFAQNLIVKDIHLIVNIDNTALKAYACIYYQRKVPAAVFSAIQLRVMARLLAEIGNIIARQELQ